MRLDEHEVPIGLGVVRGAERQRRIVARSHAREVDRPREALVCDVGHLRIDVPVSVEWLEWAGEAGVPCRRSVARELRIDVRLEQAARGDERRGMELVRRAVRAVEAPRHAVVRAPRDAVDVEWPVGTGARIGVVDVAAQVVLPEVVLV